MSMDYTYKCTAQGPLNNGLKNSCEFELKMEEGSHHCPLCGNMLTIVSDGPSVTELLRRGAELEAQKNKKQKDSE
jgi:transcription initiation factor IIE alpha subunit